MSFNPDEIFRDQVFKSELMEGETIQWFGQPNPNILFDKMDIFLIPFSLLWGGFAIFWETMALTMTRAAHSSVAYTQSPGTFSPSAHPHGGPETFFPLFGIPFVLIGLYMIFGRFFYKRWKKKNTYYAVTDRRVLVLTTWPGRSVQAQLIKSIPTINKNVRADGSGTLTFGNMPYYGSFGNTGWPSGGYGVAVPTFYDIKDAQNVYDLVTRLMEGKDSSGS